MLLLDSLKINRDLSGMKTVIKRQRKQHLDFINFIQCLCNAFILHDAWFIYTLQDACQTSTVQVFVQNENMSLS